MRTFVAATLSTLVLTFVVPASAQQQMPMQPQTVAQPMRYILTSGTVVIGSLVSEDAEFLTVSTAGGLVRIRRIDIASMDYQTGMVAQPPVVQAQMTAQPMYPPPPPPPRRRRGRGLIIAGAIVFGISYGLSALIGSAAGQEDSDAYWFLLPVAGPIIWAGATDCDDEFDEACRSATYTVGIFLTAVQAAGAVMLIVGLSRSSGDDEEASNPTRISLGGGLPPLDVAPVLSSRFQGLALQGAF